MNYLFGGNRIRTIWRRPNSAINAQQIRTAAKGPVNAGNVNSVLVSLERDGEMFGLDQLRRIVQDRAQLLHENGDFSRLEAMQYAILLTGG